jgi:ABC-type multidrug transport system permease subunit
VLADIASGNTGFADVMFLVALVLFIIALVADVMIRPNPSPWWRVAVAGGLACVALGWLVL